MATSLDEIKILSGIPLAEAKMPPRTKETFHKAASGTEFILAPVKVRSGKWKAVKKGSAMDNDWLVKSKMSGKPVGIVSYDEGEGTWTLQRLKGDKVNPSMAAESPSLAKVLSKA
jgi:hypothetical protein